MTRGLPRAASATAAASLPPPPLDGLDPAFSRVVHAPESGTERERGWHVLDTGPWLESRGIRPVGTILCVHGNPTWSYLWRRLIAAATDAGSLGDDVWRVIAVDQLDMGFSERTGQSRQLARRVRDLGDLTDALALEGDVVTLGHDWGGVVSLGWAVDHPQLLAGVMLLNTAVHQPEGVPIPWPLRLSLAGGVLGPATVGTPAFLETTLALAHPPLSSAVKDGYRAPYRSASRRGGIGGFVADIPASGSHASSAELDRVATGVAALEVPALMLWGPRDPIFGDRYLDDLIDRMPHADVHRYEGAGHLIAEDVDYATAVLEWLSDDRDSRRSGRTEADGRRSSGTEPARPVPKPGADPSSPAPEARRLWHFLDELRDSDETALIEMAPPSGAGRRTVSWRLLSRRVRQLAAGLHDIGVRPGDRVSLLVRPGADLTAVLYACLRIGAIVVVADAGLGLRGLTRAVRGAQPDYLVGAPLALTAARALGWGGIRISTNRMSGTAAGRALRVEHSLADLVDRGDRILAVADARLPSSPAPDHTAAVLFTSGSTGPAKGVVYTHAQLSALAGVLAAQYGIGVGTGLVAGFAPFALLGPALGARSVTPEMDVTAPRTLTARAVADAVQVAEGAQGTVLFLSPAAIANVVATADGLSSDGRRALARVRTFLSAGAPVSRSLLEAAAQLMPAAQAHTPYGMTEGLLMTDASLDEIRGTPATDRGGVLVGRPIPGVDVLIAPLDDLGAATGAPTTGFDVTGEIVVSAAHLKRGYDRLARTDRAATSGTPTGGRWHRTGDVGRLDAEGRLWVEGRLPHVISTAEGPVTPVGVEQSAERAPGVARAAAVGVGPVGTQQVVAVVETAPAARRPALASAELAASVRLSSPTPIAAVLVTPALPTDIRHNSKIDRARVARWAERVLSGGRMSAL